MADSVPKVLVDLMLGFVCYVHNLGALVCHPVPWPRLAQWNRGLPAKQAPALALNEDEQGAEAPLEDATRECLPGEAVAGASHHEAHIGEAGL